MPTDSLVVKSDLTRNYQRPFMPPTSKKLDAIFLLGCQSVRPFVTLFSILYHKRNVYARILIFHMEPSHHKLKVVGRVAQLVAHLT